MIYLNKLGMCLAFVVLFALPCAAQDFSRYRDFEFGMGVDSVSKLTRSEVGNVRTLHKIPDLIQTVQWDRREYFPGSTTTDPVRSIRFDFCDNQLFKMIVTYDVRQIEGMTADDLIEAIAKVYGVWSRPDESVDVSAYTVYEERNKVLARWENSESSFSLFQSSYGGGFGLVALSKNLELIAAGSIREARRLEAVAAPQREADRLQKESDSRRAREEKARAVNTPNFRP